MTTPTIPPLDPEQIAHLAKLAHQAMADVGAHVCAFPYAIDDCVGYDMIIERIHTTQPTIDEQRPKVDAFLAEMQGEPPPTKDVLDLMGALRDSIAQKGGR